MFDKNNIYVFSAKLVKHDNPCEADLSWLHKCDNKIVKIIENGYLGEILIDGTDYKILRKWCRRLDPSKLDAFLKATKQTNPNK